MDQTRSRVTVLSPNHLPETPAVLEVRHAVRRWLDAYAPAGVVSVGLSGGADSLALLAATVVEGSAVRAIVVDHQLQPDSGAVALGAAEHARRLGATAEVCAVEVGSEGGVEAAARAARYEALTARAKACRSCSDTLSMIRRRRYFWDLRAGPDRDRSGACGPTTRRGGGRYSASGGR